MISNSKRNSAMSTNYYLKTIFEKEYELPLKIDLLKEKSNFIN